MIRSFRLTATILAALFAAVLFAAPAYATTTQSPLAGTTFQAGDGDQEAAGDLRDWGTVAPTPGTTMPDPPTAGPNMFGEGSKEEAPGAWTLVGREPSNKFDFLAAWARPESGEREDLYLAFRRDSPNGDTYLTFELNQDTRRWDNDGSAATPAIPCRMDRDVLLSYEIEPGGKAEPDPVTVRLYRWHEATDDGVTGCSLTGTLTGGEALNPPLGSHPLAQGAINEDGPIANHLDTDGDGDADTPVFERSTFGEAGLNVTAAVEQLGLECAAFGQVQLHSRASVSITSAVKDYVAPVPLDLDTCRTQEPPTEEPPTEEPPTEEPPTEEPPTEEPPVVAPPKPGSPKPGSPPGPPHAPEPTPVAGQQVLGAQQARPRQVRGRARLRGPSGCVYRTFRANVSGRQIRRVTFFVDGRRVAIRRARNGQRTFTARVTPGRLSLGVHRVTARVVFRTASRTRPRTLVLSFQRCARQAPSPRFTG
jgi:hypothetical protein